jgi:hypothetical protein
MFFGDPYVNTAVDSGIDVDIFLWESVDFKPAPGFIDSFRVMENEMIYSQWMSIDYSALNLTFDSDFHAGWSPAFEKYQSDRALQYGAYMRYTNNSDEPLKDVVKHRSIEYSGAAGWITAQESYNQRFDFHIRAVVDYGTGEATMLKPGSGLAGITEEVITQKNTINRNMKQGTGCE